MNKSLNTMGNLPPHIVNSQCTQWSVENMKTYHRIYPEEKTAKIITHFHNNVLGIYS